MTKTDGRRATIVEQLADYVLAEGLSASSLRPLAAASGTSDRMLLYYFKDKAELMAAALERIAVRFAEHLEGRLSDKRLPSDQLRKKILTIVLAPEAWPYMRVWLEIAAKAGRNETLFRVVGEQIARGFLAFAEAHLDVPPRKRRREALALLALVEGTVLLKSLGLDEVERI